MLMPGENGEATLTLLRPMPLASRVRFTLRSTNGTIATGVITELLPNVNVKDFDDLVKASGGRSLLSQQRYAAEAEARRRLKREAKA